MKELQEALKNCLVLAQEKFGVCFEEVELDLGLKGRCAGMACQTDGKLKIRLNLQLDVAYLVSDVIPHEVAHLACYLDESLGNAHNAGWKHVCVELGGKPDVYHDKDLAPSRKTRMFSYQDSEGDFHELTIIRHNKLQRDKVSSYSVVRTGALITKDGFQAEV